MFCDQWQCYLENTAVLSAASKCASTPRGMCLKIIIWSRYVTEKTSGCHGVLLHYSSGYGISLPAFYPQAKFSGIQMLTFPHLELFWHLRRQLNSLSPFDLDTLQLNTVKYGILLALLFTINFIIEFYFHQCTYLDEYFWRVVLVLL